MSLSEMITYSTVKISCEYADGSKGSGTGFIINLCNNEEEQKCVPVIITNNHVVENAKSTLFSFCRKNEDGSPNDQEVINFQLIGEHWINHPDSSVDLRCFPIGRILNDLDKRKQPIFYIPLNTSIIPNKQQISSLGALEELVMVGYPIGLSDEYNHKPVLRKGTTATHLKNNYQGKQEFLMDMACFPGSSGSPVFIYNEGTYTTGKGGIIMGNRLYLVGILYGGPEYAADGVLRFSNLPNIPRPVISIPTNLGIAIKAERILEFEKLFLIQSEEINNE